MFRCHFYRDPRLEVLPSVTMGNSLNSSQCPHLPSMTFVRTSSSALLAALQAAGVGGIDLHCSGTLPMQFRALPSAPCFVLGTNLPGRWRRTCAGLDFA